MKKVETNVVVLSTPPTPIHIGQSSQIAFVWIATLLISSLPDILLRELHLFPAFPILWMRIILLLIFITLGFVWKAAQPLRPYFIIFMAVYLVDALFNWIGGTAVWQQWFGGAAASFSKEIMGSQLLRLGVAFTIIALLWLLQKRRQDFFLAKGDLNATAQPVHWLGMDRPMGWTRFGLILTVCITLGTLTFLIISGHPSLNSFARILPLLPIILFASAMNAFSEEITFRAALLSPLYGMVGRSQALLLTAILFGLWHYYGVPYGVIGVIMAGTLGWLLGKSMVETKGMFWAWFIHFWQDVAIFTFIALGSITPGG